MFILLAAIIPTLLVGQTLKVERIGDELLSSLLNLATVQSLNTGNPYGESVIVKLYSIPGGEYSFVADHYLAVTTWGEWPPHAVYSLGRFGDIDEVEWLPPHPSDQFRVEICSKNKVASEYGQPEPICRFVRFQVSPDSLVVTEMP